MTWTSERCRIERQLKRKNRFKGLDGAKIRLEMASYARRAPLVIESVTRMVPNRNYLTHRDDIDVVPVSVARVRWIE